MKSVWLSATVIILLIAGTFLLLRRISVRPKDAEEQTLLPFERQEKETHYDLTYRWKGYQEESFQGVFSVSKTDLAESEKEFGYEPAELASVLAAEDLRMREETIRSLKNLAREEMARSRYAPYFVIEETGALAFNLNFRASPRLHDEVQAELDRISVRLAAEQAVRQERGVQELEAKKRLFLESRGLRFIGEKLGIDYGWVIDRNRPRLKPVLEVMQAQNSALSLRRFLDFLLSFLQQVRYRIPPLQENSRFILGLWVPFRVLVENLGDCDSKGVTFSCLWTNLAKYPLILIKVPNHLFVGVAVPMFGSDSITVGGLRYTLCEVTGPSRLPPGLLTNYSRLCLDGGQYVYELIR
jgi:hypothetical protein